MNVEIHGSLHAPGRTWLVSKVGQKPAGKKGRRSPRISALLREIIRDAMAPRGEGDDHVAGTDCVA